MPPSTSPLDRRTIAWLCGITAGILLLRAGYDGLPPDRLSILLEPTAWCIRLATGAEWSTSTHGLAFPALRIVLDRSCAGGHFAIVLAGFLLFLHRHRFTSAFPLLVGVVTVIALSVPITIIGNVWRVLITLAVAHADPTRHFGGTVTAHLVIGATVQLGLLLIVHGLHHHLTSIRRLA